MLIFFGCKGDDSLCCPHPNPTNCNEFSIIDETKYNQTNTNNYTITNVVLNGDCLEITVSSSGCNPNNWDMNFVASEVVVETLPNQWNAKVELINNEACQAVFQKTVSFDLTPFKIIGQNQVQINIAGWNNSIMYQY
ncbi:hypothetical protein SAMN05421741_102145 [Paenimyroides ummariense]|uniref:Uncharacterized protein n=2 Tax=Paenimyroides ummariense TaxID=913024 RepID=A0A1I4X651_9FLAO|nr:hypothetical protein SAMN05421741_102145 [Paenimyroides ummariense]